MSPASASCWRPADPRARAARALRPNPGCPPGTEPSAGPHVAVQHAFGSAHRGPRRIPRWTGVIPRALIADRSGPLAAGDRGEAVGRRRQPVPGLAAGRDDRLVVRPDAMAELVLPQVLPDVLDRVQLGAVAR